MLWLQACRRSYAECDLNIQNSSPYLGESEHWTPANNKADLLQVSVRCSRVISCHSAVIKPTYAPFSTG